MPVSGDCGADGDCVLMGAEGTETFGRAEWRGQETVPRRGSAFVSRPFTLGPCSGQPTTAPAVTADESSAGSAARGPDAPVG